MATTSGGQSFLSLAKFIPLTVTSRFFDDIDLLRQRWRSDNTESVAELYVSMSTLEARRLIWPKD